MDRNAKLKQLRKNGSLLQEFQDLQNDKEAVSIAVHQNEHAFQFAHDDLKHDKKFILSILRDPAVLEFASPSIRADRDFMLAAIKINGNAFEYANRFLKEDRTLAIAAVTCRGDSLDILPDHFKGDKEIALIAVKRFGSILSEVSDELKHDKEVVLAAVKEEHSALESVPEEMKDQDVLFAAMIEFDEEDYFEFVPDEIKEDRRFMLHVLRYNGFIVHMFEEPDPEVLAYAKFSNKPCKDLTPDQDREALDFLKYQSNVLYQTYIASNASGFSSAPITDFVFGDLKIILKRYIEKHPIKFAGKRIRKTKRRK